MSLYLDANILVSLHVPEPTSLLVEAWLAARDDDMLIGDLAVGEFGATISRLTRMEKLSVEQARTVLDTFDAWRQAVAEPVENTPSDIRTAGQYVRRPDPKLLMPDAIHLATCQRLGATLVTMDGDLSIVAIIRGMPVLMPS